MVFFLILEPKKKIRPKFSILVSSFVKLKIWNLQLYSETKRYYVERKSIPFSYYLTRHEEALIEI